MPPHISSDPLTGHPSSGGPSPAHRALSGPQVGTQVQPSCFCPPCSPVLGLLSENSLDFTQLLCCVDGETEALRSSLPTL